MHIAAKFGSEIDSVCNKVDERYYIQFAYNIAYKIDTI